MTTLSPWVPKPKKKGNSTFLKKEEDRWAALHDDPTSFVRNPLKYGELTVDGYTKARLSPKLVYRDTWPKGPDAIASLLLQCGIDVSQAGRVVGIHASRLKYDIDQQSMLSELLCMHIAILKRLHIPPGLQELNDVLEHTSIMHLNFADYMRSFDVMRDYLETAEDESVFLDGLLARLTPSRHCYSSDHTTGLALAASFTRTNPDKIIEWCKRHDDQVGLGYLVIQGKYPFSEWMIEVAKPSHGLRIRHNEDHDESMVTRSHEQLDTLTHMVAQLPDEVFAQQGPLVLKSDPNLASILFDRTQGQPSSTASIAWSLLLVRTNVVNVNHPVVERWVKSATREQRALIVKALADNESDHFRKHGDAPSGMFTTLPEVTEKISLQARQLLATNFIFESHPQRMADIIRNMPTTTWLKELPIADAVVARANTLDANECLDTVLALYAFLPADEKVKCVPLLMATPVIDHPLSKSMVKTLQHMDPAQYAKGLASKHKGIGYLMHHLTQKDPDEALVAVAASMAALDISKNDPAYLSALQKWVVEQIAVTKLAVTMPQDIGDASFNTFNI